MSGARKRPAGPPTAGGPEYLVIGKIRRPHGVHGEVVAELSTDFPERILPKKAIYLGGRHTKLVLASVRPHKEGLLLGFEGVNTPEQAGLYRNQVISIPFTEAQDLPEGEYYFHELVDLEVFDETGRCLGRLKEILETGANDVYVVQDESGAELLLPAIPEVILDVDVPSGKMLVHLIPGLIDSQDAV